MSHPHPVETVKAEQTSQSPSSTRAREHRRRPRPRGGIARRRGLARRSAGWLHDRSIQRCMPRGYSIQAATRTSPAIWANAPAAESLGSIHARPCVS